jgi:hypothetical protein
VYRIKLFFITKRQLCILTFKISFYYNLNKQLSSNTSNSSGAGSGVSSSGSLVSNQEEKFYLSKIKANSDSITRLKNRAQTMQLDVDKSKIVNREMNKNKLQNYVDTQKRNIDIIMKRIIADKNKIQTNINIPSSALNDLLAMINSSTQLSAAQKADLTDKLINNQNMMNFISDGQYNANLNNILKSCPSYDLTGLVKKTQVSDVCYGCDNP